jgi:hypothetical protein
LSSDFDLHARIYIRQNVLKNRDIIMHDVTI